MSTTGNEQETVQQELKEMVDDPLIGSVQQIRIYPPDSITRDNAIRGMMAIAPQFQTELLTHLSASEPADWPVLVRHLVDQGFVQEPIMETVMIRSVSGEEVPASFETGEYRKQVRINPDTGVEEETGARYHAFSHETLEWITEDELLQHRKENAG